MRRYHRPACAVLALTLGLTPLTSGCGRSASPAVETAAESAAKSAVETTAATAEKPEKTAEAPTEPAPAPETTLPGQEESSPGASAASPETDGISPDSQPSPKTTVPASGADSPSCSLAPRLPETGGRLDDFVPEGWTLMDSVSLDFNRDGRSDYVGVLDKSGDGIPIKTPRILFAVTGCEADCFQLDFQDENLIRTRNEGGVFGDPYVPLTAENTAFTINAFGGSAWKWSEASTYVYRDGTWYLSYAYTTYGYGPYITSEREEDYETGVGVRRERCSDFERIENGDPGDEFDLVYQVRLDEPPTISQAGKRWWLSPDRLTDCPVKTITVADGLDLDESQVKLPLDGRIQYRDEHVILYTFASESGQKNHLACYQEADQSLSVAAESTEEMPGFESCLAYKGKLYYVADVKGDVMLTDESGAAVESQETVAQRLFSLNPDGSGRQMIFEYRLARPGDVIPDRFMPYLSMICEITGDEIIAQVYIGGQPHPYYRMNLDGSNVRQIGVLPDNG